LSKNTENCCIYIETTDTWVPKSNYPGTSGWKHAYFSIGDYGYVVDNVTNIIYRYAPAAGTWAQALSCPVPYSSTGYKFGVALNGKAYFLDLNNGKVSRSHKRKIGNYVKKKNLPRRTWSGTEE
jgi:hypothetical protein